MRELTRFRPDTDLDLFVAALERDGGAIVEDFVSPSTLAGLWEDLGPSLDATDYCGDWYNGTRTRRLSSLFARTPHVHPLVTQPLYLGAARALMQRPRSMWIGRSRVDVTPGIQISGTQVIQIGPGQGKQPLHRDDALHLRGHPGPVSRLQLMLAMSDFTEENGGTQVIPGSHHWDDERAPETSEAIPTRMRAGSALIWEGGVYHNGGRNTSEEPRTGLTIALDLGNLRQEENQYLAVPPGIAADLPEEIQRLLGYDRCPPGLGWLEMDDPRLILDDRLPGTTPISRQDPHERADHE